MYDRSLYLYSNSYNLLLTPEKTQKNPVDSLWATLGSASWHLQRWQQRWPGLCLGNLWAVLNQWWDQFSLIDMIRYHCVYIYEYIYVHNHKYIICTKMQDIDMVSIHENVLMFYDICDVYASQLFRVRFLPSRVYLFCITIPHSHRSKAGETCQTEFPGNF